MDNAMVADHRVEASEVLVYRRFYGHKKDLPSKMHPPVQIAGVPAEFDGVGDAARL
jgi:hypothetical protein